MTIGAPGATYNGGSRRISSNAVSGAENDKLL